MVGPSGSPPSSSGFSTSGIRTRHGLGLANILVAGLFLGVVYLKTASLWWATGAHLGWNWAHGFLSDLPVSGLELVDTPLLEPTTQGPEWLSGGSFGPEGSILSTLILLGGHSGPLEDLLASAGRSSERSSGPSSWCRDDVNRSPGDAGGARTIGDLGREK